MNSETQLDLFREFQLGAAHLSRVLPLWDLLPLYLFARQTELPGDTPIAKIPALHHEFESRGERIAVDVEPAILRDSPTAAPRIVFPGEREQLVASADTWLPIVRRMRPQKDWATVVAEVNKAGGRWTVERLLRAVKRLVGERLAEPQLLGRAPRKPSNQRALAAAAAMRLTNPSLSLREIGAQLQAMKIPSPRGHLNWSASMVAQLFKVPTT